MTENFNINIALDEYDKVPAGANAFANELPGEPYADEFRKLSLNKLLHLAPYSEVLLVSGPKDIGKSTLIEQFAGRAAESWRVAFIKASPVMTTRAFLIQVAQSLGLNFDDSDNQDDLSWELIRHLQALGRSGRRAILIIDDAHLLLAEVLSVVEDVLEDERSLNAMSVVMSMDSDQESRLRSFPVLQDRLAYTLNMEPLSELGVDEYIRHRLLQANNPDAIDYFTTETIDELFQQSHGLPGQINALARLHLAKAHAKEKNGGGRSVLRWGLAIASVAVIAVVLVLQEDINQMVEVPEAGDQIASNDLGKGEADKEQTTMLDEDKLGKEEVAAETEEKQPQSLAMTSKPTSEDKALKEERKTSLPAGVEVFTLDEAPEQVTEELAESGAGTRVVPDETKSVPVPAEKTKVAEVPSIVEKQVTPVAKAPTPTKPETKAQPEWVMAQSPSHFTLQLMALQDEKKVKQFIQQHGLTSKSGVFNVKRKGKEFTVLVYGSYGTRAAAERAAEKLPKAWGLKPWIRSFESVHQDVASR